jgi:CheY-like chemotaxis protein/anti-sigma regulatory factor (Ser/Thr protein kinase)
MRSTIQIMDRQLRQLVRLVDDLLDVSRITTGKLTLRKEDVELATVVQSALDAAQPLIEARDLRLTVRLPDAPVMLCADTTRIAQVLLNLLHNATKFTEAGGTITLAAEADAQTVTVRISDTGIGIPPGQLPQVFDMFAQLDHSLERTTSGLGVGLALSRRLVELHGGTLEAASAGAGAGSTFTVRLPREGIATRPAAVDAAAGAPSTPARHRVLLVDDNADFVESFGLLLERMGHQVRLAHDGEEALTAAREFAPDVAFLDIGLPRINGYDLAPRLRAQSSGPVLLIAVTGWGQDSDKRRAREAGFDHHMTKPVDLEQVGRLLAAANGPAVRPQNVPGGEMA